jgi:hydrogenase assembly chaperone HypC/HupF
MCIDDPGRVIAIDDLGAIVETPTHRRRASTLLLPDVAVGDWVTVAAGTIVDRLTPEEAGEIREILDRAADPLRSCATTRVPDPASAPLRGRS